ncbi:hypothetical protein EG832_18105 [bacterium]|nr:hypothetical protein [bacterium]
MKKNNYYNISEISSFEDIRIERARLNLRSKLIETKIKIDIIQTKEALPLSALLLSVARKFVPQDIYEIVEGIAKR